MVPSHFSVPALSIDQLNMSNVALLVSASHPSLPVDPPKIKEPGTLAGSQCFAGSVSLLSLQDAICHFNLDLLIEVSDDGSHFFFLHFLLPIFPP